MPRRTVAADRTRDGCACRHGCGRLSERLRLSPVTVGRSPRRDRRQIGTPEPVGGFLLPSAYRARQIFRTRRHSFRTRDGCPVGTVATANPSEPVAVTVGGCACHRRHGFRTCRRDRRKIGRGEPVTVGKNSVLPELSRTDKPNFPRTRRRGFRGVKIPLKATGRGFRLCFIGVLIILRENRGAK